MRARFRGHVVAWILSSLVAAAAAGALAPVAASTVGPSLATEPLALLALLVLGPIWLTLCSMLQGALYVSWRSAAFQAEIDREWTAKLSGLEFIAALGLSALLAACLVLPEAIRTDRLQGWIAWAVGLLTGSLAVLGGRSPLSLVNGAVQAGSSPLFARGFSKAVAAAALVCIPLLFAGASLLGQTLESGLLGLLPETGQEDASARAGDVPPARDRPLPLGYPVGSGEERKAPADPPPPGPRLLVGVSLCALLPLAGWLAGRTVNVNRFSMHGVYRNRLSRAFLGAVRRRRQDPFTDFDPDDNVGLAALWPWADRGTRASQRKCLFPVINATLNLLRSHRQDWAERKAASFTMTPLRCGSAALGGHDASPGGETPGAYARTGDYAGLVNPRLGSAVADRARGATDGTDRPVNEGLDLATAMTISGAAASPNMGYVSSRPAALLMTLFNLRLGCWLPNPARGDAASLSVEGPRSAVYPLLAEMLGRTDEEQEFVSLSDGGHFENLGLYEMVRRRCRYVLVSDATADPECDFTDLGNATRRIRVDFGIEITLAQPVRIKARNPDQRAAAEDGIWFATGEIHYPDGRPGRLVYVKPSYMPTLPTDLLSYGRSSPLFPHEPTMDQWFGESQFESYRRLGLEAVMGLDPRRRPVSPPHGANDPGAPSRARPRRAEFLDFFRLDSGGFGRA